LRRWARPTRIVVKAMMRSGKLFAGSKRGLCWNTALAFLFFLAFSAPHRVHHVYEQLAASSAPHIAHAVAHDHFERNDRRPHDNQPASKPNDCVVLSVAQSAHLSLVSSFDLPIVATPVSRCADHPVVTIKSFNTTPGSPRAPPRV